MNGRNSSQVVTTNYYQRKLLLMTKSGMASTSFTRVLTLTKDNQIILKNRYKFIVRVRIHFKQFPSNRKTVIGFELIPSGTSPQCKHRFTVHLDAEQFPNN